MLKKLLYLYNDGHIPFPNMHNGGLGYHLPRYHRRRHGDGFNLDTLQFEPELDPITGQYDMTQEDADRRNGIIAPDINRLVDEYGLTTTPHNDDDDDDKFTYDEQITDPDERLERIPLEFYDDRLRSVLSAHNLDKDKYNTSLKSLVKSLGLKPIKSDPTKTQPTKDDYINILVKSKDIRPKLLKIIKKENSYNKTEEYHNNRTQEIREYNVYNETMKYIKNKYPIADEETVINKTEELIKNYKKLGAKSDKDYINLLSLHIRDIKNPKDFEYPNINIKKITDKTTPDEVEEMLIQIQNYKFHAKYANYKYPTKEDKLKFGLIEEIEIKLMRRLEHLGYNDIYDYMKTVIPNDKYVYNAGIQYYVDKGSGGTGLAFEDFILSNDMLPIFKNMMGTEKDIEQTSNLSSIPDKKIQIDVIQKDGTMKRVNKTLADFCMVDTLSDDQAIDIKDYRKQKGDFYEIQSDKLYGNGSYRPIYKEDATGKVKLNNIQLKNHNNQNIVKDSERSYYFYMLYNDGIYRYNLLDDDNFNQYVDTKTGNIKFFDIDAVDNGKFENENLVNLGYLDRTKSGEPAFFLDSHGKACFRIPKNEKDRIVKFIDN
jgi:hypothetical protein